MRLPGTNAAIVWTESGGKGSERVFLLPAPLRAQVAAHDRVISAVDSLDRSQREVFAHGTGADELVGTIAFASNPQGLLDMLKAGASGTTLTYYPDLNDTSQSHTVLLVAPIGGLALQRDPLTGDVLGDQSVEVRFRRTDETPFPGAWNKDELFRYHAGDRLDDATVTRASSASYPDKGLGTGAHSTAGVARVGWFRASTGDRARTLPALLVERGRVNALPESSDFGQWTAVSAPTRTSGQADPFGGTAAWLITDNSGAAVEYYQDQFVSTSTGTPVFSCWLKESSQQSTQGNEVALTRSTAGSSFLCRAVVTWSSGVPSANVTNGVAVMSPERWTNGWWRFAIRSTQTISTGTTYEVRAVPSQSAASTGTGLFHGFQVEV